MTDKEKLVELLESWGVTYKEEDDPDGEIDIYVGDRDYDNNNNKVVGYSGFYTLYTFNADGTFKEMGAWE